MTPSPETPLADRGADTAGIGPAEVLRGRLTVRYHPVHRDVFLQMSGAAGWFVSNGLRAGGSKSGIGAHYTARTALFRNVLVEVRFARGGGLLAPYESGRPSHFMWQKNIGAWTLGPDGVIEVLGPAGAILSSLIRTGQARDAKFGQKVRLVLEDVAEGRLRLVDPAPTPEEVA